MASPDFSRYVDLTIFDEQPSAIYQSAIDYARESFPELDFVPGGVEEALLQSVALMTGYTAAAINRLPDAVAEIIVGLLGVQRATGSVASASAAFDFIDGRTAVIPAGTRLSYTDSSGLEPIVYTFQTTSSVEGTGSVIAPIEAFTLQRYPSLPSGQVLRLLTPISFVSSVELSSALFVGDGPESNDSYLTRGIQTLQSYSSTLVTPRQFEAYVTANYADVFRCKTYSRVDVANDDVGNNTENGYVGIYACGIDGEVLSTSAPTLFAVIEADLAEKAVAGLEIHVADPHLVEFTVETTVKIVATADSDDVKTAIVAAISNYLDPDYWDWSEVVRYNEIIALISNVEGVEYVDSLTLTGGVGSTVNGSDYEFDKYGSLPTNAMTVDDVSLAT